MRAAFTIAAVTAGLAMMTVPAAAQGFYAGYDQPGYGAYAYSGPGACTCGGPAAAYGYSRSYAPQPNYAYAPQPGYAYAPQPGYAYSSTTYAYDPGYAYGRSYGYDAYAYDPGFAYSRSYGYDGYVGEPGYARRGAAVAARGELREDFGPRSGVVRSGTVARERSVVRTSARDQATVGVRERGAGVRTGSTVRSSANVRESTSGVRARSNEMRGEATVGRGGGEPRGTMQGNAEFRGAPAARSGEPRGRAGNANESGMR
jgi:hypothetical protein